MSLTCIIIDDIIVSFSGLTSYQIGEKLLEASPNKDGRGLVLVLTEDEERAFENAGGMAIGYSIADLIGDAMKKDGRNLTGPKYRYDPHSYTFTT